MKLRVELINNLPTFAGEKGAAIRRGAMRGAERIRARAKLAFRQDTRSVLGDRAANTWRDEVYPKGGKASWHPTALIYSKWPAVIRAHTDGAEVVHKKGLLLAIPTDNVPRRGGKTMTPAEVEQAFGGELFFVKRGGTTLAFIKVVESRSKKGWRKASRKAGARPAKTKMILMFVMVKQVTLRKRLNWPTIARELQPAFASYLATEISRELSK